MEFSFVVGILALLSGQTNGIIVSVGHFHADVIFVIGGIGLRVVVDEDADAIFVDLVDEASLEISLLFSLLLL